jgi:lactate permease
MLLDWCLALTPLLLMVVLMIGFRWGAAKAGPAGWLAAVLVAALRFGAGIDLLAAAQVKALLLGLDVLPIIWGAFLFYRVADEAGAVRTIGQALPHLTADRGMQALLIGWAFATFLQGVGGFGVPVAVTAPLLVGLGFSPMAAVLAPSVGHSWSVTFGSLASSFQALIAGSGLPGETLAAASATMLGLAGIGCGMMVVTIADGLRSLPRLILPALILGLAMGTAQYVLATHGLWNIAGLGAGIAGLAVGLVLARAYRGNSRPDSRTFDKRTLLLALSGYLTLIAITLAIQLYPPLRAFLSQVAFQAPLPATQTVRGFLTPASTGPRIVIFRNAGAILGYSSLVTYALYRRAGLFQPGALKRIFTSTLRGVLSGSLAIVAMIGLAVVMEHAGMTDTLAQGLAQGTGGLFPLASPWIGMLGAFISGTNTNSNLLLAMIQRRTAELLRLPVAVILGAQTAGGAIGSVVAPTKVVVGISSSNGAVREGEVMRRLLVYVGILVLGLSLIAWAWIRLLGL